MFIAKRIVLRDRRLAYWIYTSAVRDCKKNDKTNRILNALIDDYKEEKKKGREKCPLYPVKIVSPEEKIKAKDGLGELLKDVLIETDPDPKNKDDMDTYFTDMLKVQTERKKERKKFRKNFLEDKALFVQAANDVAQELGGNKEKIKEDLLEHLKTIQIANEDEPETVQVMEVHDTKFEQASTLNLLRKLMSSEGLKIFNKNQETKETIRLNIWDRLEEEQLAFKKLRAPRNQFEEWILWTKQKKLWHFPIDNDQGMDKEAEVDFTQHVFLEEHLHPWCPKKGPLKKFMDLVLVGLSKNPYLTVEDKKEHIFWYRDYFEKKKKLLQELGAFGSAKEIGESTKPEETV